MRFTRFAPPLASLAGLALLAACGARVVPPSAPPPTPAPAPAPAPTPAPTPVPSFSSWMDAPATPGDWSFQAGLEGAVFAATPDRPLLRFSCSRDDRVVQIARYVANFGTGELRINTETRRGVLQTTVAEPGAFRIARVSANDPLLDAIAFSKGRFAVEMDGAPTLYVPAYPEISRVIEDCR